MTEATRLAERADKCAKYGFDSVEMVEVKWALWDEIIAALRAMPQERPSDAYAGPVVTHDMMAWYPPSKALESLAPSPASAREEKREFIGVMNALLLVENGCNDEAAKRFADTFAEKCSENAKLIARIAELEIELPEALAQQRREFGNQIDDLHAELKRVRAVAKEEIKRLAALAPSAQEGETDRLQPFVQFVADGWDNQEINHEDFRARVGRAALELLASPHPRPHLAPLPSETLYTPEEAEPHIEGCDRVTSEGEP